MKMNHFFIHAILAAFSMDVVFSKSWKNQDNNGEMCLSGDGRDYRGYVSTSKYGHRCLRWSKIKKLRKIGNHNFCRNPDESLMPWCLVQRKGRIVREFCDIPKCSLSAVDTELTCGERVEKRMFKVVGGSFTAIESQPWVAAIYHGGSFLCGGSLISPCWLVTAAHCFTHMKDIDVKTLSVYLGKSALNETDVDKEQHFTAKKLIIHQNYNDSNFDNDIALLMIKSKNGECAVKSASTRVVCLPPSHTQLPSGFECSVAGFGRESYRAWHFSQYLKKGEVKLLSDAECKKEKHYGNLITNNMMCAASPDWTTDACEGDSGGPLVCEVSGRMFLFGVVSWGENCAKKDKPGVYTKISNYDDWIARKTGLSEYTKGKMYPLK